MAESPAHRFGQIIGNTLEAVVQPYLERFCAQHGLFLDHQSRSRRARPGKKVAWQDSYGNTHDLDFVIERDGNDETLGRPVAFVEVAWRRYTKHSRNKAQEIQGAILPLAERFRWNNPFLGAVLAGVFTEGSLEQLRSLGFHVLYFPYETLVEAFGAEGIIIRFDETTPDEAFQQCSEAIENSPVDRIQRIQNRLVESNQAQLDQWFSALASRLARQVVTVIVIPLYGRLNRFYDISAAIQFLDAHQLYEGSGEFRKYEIRVEFSNGDNVSASLDSKQRVREFLEFVANQ